MGAKDKKRSVKEKKRSKKTKLEFPKEAGEIRDAAIKFLGDAEKSGEKLTAEVKHFFEKMAEHVTAVAGTAAKTTASVTEKVAATEPRQHLSQVMDEVKEAGEVSMRALGEGFDALRAHIMSLAPATSEKQTPVAAEKPATRKKAAAKKPAAKKTAAKRPTAKKKVAAKKIAKKRTAKKKATSKKTTKKPATAKKAPARQVAKKSSASTTEAGT